MGRSHGREDAAPSAPASKWLNRAVRARWVLLGCYLLLNIGWYVVFFSRWDPLGLSFVEGWPLRAFLLSAAVLFGMQWLLLLGAPQLSWPRPRRRRSIFVSLAAGSAIAVLLSAGIVFAGVSLYQLIRHPASFGIEWSATATAGVATTAPAPPPPPAAFDWRTDIPWDLIGVLLVAWTFWFVVFAIIGAGQWTKGFGRMYRMLIAGTVLELLITIPIDVQVRRRTNCYCGEGTFLSLVIGLTAILWTFGPGVAILFLARRRQRLLVSGRCLYCGYDLRMLQNPRCPECGAPLPEPAAARC